MTFSAYKLGEIDRLTEIRDRLAYVHTQEHTTREYSAYDKANNYHSDNQNPNPHMKAQNDFVVQTLVQYEINYVGV